VAGFNKTKSNIVSSTEVNFTTTTIIIIRLRSATWRSRHPHRCWTSTGCKHTRASSVPLRSACWRKRTYGLSYRGGNGRCAGHHSLNDLCRPI